MLRTLTFAFVLCGLASTASAQSTLLVLDPIGADPATASSVVASLRSVAESAGHHVVTPAAGSVVGALSPDGPSDLLSLTLRSGVDVSVATWITRGGEGSTVRVGVAVRDGTSGSSIETVPDAEVGLAAARMLGRLLPGPSAQRTWDDAPARPRGGVRGIGLIVGGAVVLGATWALNIIGGLFGGYHDTSWVDLWDGDSGCCGVFDPAWDNFRAASLVPVAGPWIQLALLPDYENGWPVWLVADGLGQIAGLTMLIIGIEQASHGAQAEPIALLPMISPEASGLMLSGTF
jgi:hypothetical protein